MLLSEINLQSDVIQCTMKYYVARGLAGRGRTPTHATSIISLLVAILPQWMHLCGGLLNFDHEICLLVVLIGDMGGFRSF